MALFACSGTFKQGNGSPGAPGGLFLHTPLLTEYRPSCGRATREGASHVRAAKDPAKTNVEVYGAIYLKTDGERLITAFKIEEQSATDKWFYYEYACKSAVVLVGHRLEWRLLESPQGAPALRSDELMTPRLAFCSSKPDPAAIDSLRPRNGNWTITGCIHGRHLRPIYAALPAAIHAFRRPLDALPLALSLMKRTM